MTSRFGWVDFAEKDRQRMLEVIGIFREHDTRDELGIGTIRDAFADYFFPGTSTIQTRARYMLFIPWIYRVLEDKEVSSAKFPQRVRQDEIKLINALLQSTDSRGVIGKEAREKLQRLPSSIYWFGLASWGIRRFSGSQDQYFRFLDTFYTRRRQKQSIRSEIDQELALETVVNNWDPGLPDPPPGFPQKAELALTSAEALYLQDRIRLRHRDSLLAFLVTEKVWSKADFFWLHPVISRVPAKLYQDVQNAQNFSETIYGAALLYNLMLARKRSERKISGKPGDQQLAADQELVDDYESRFDEWVQTLANRWAELVVWHNNLPAFWSSPALQLARIPHPTRTFVEKWLKLLFSYDQPSNQLADNRAAQELIRNRELELKKLDRARLYDSRALERWVGYSGDQQLEYRWSTAQDFAVDILAGLQRREDTHA